MNPVLIKVFVPPNAETKDVLTHMLAEFTKGHSVQLFVPRGKGQAFAARMRIMLSRARKKLETQGIPRREFILRTDIRAWTHADGNTVDSIICWEHRPALSESKESLARFIYG